MRKIIQVPLSETGPLAAALRNGHAVELMDGEERIATVVPAVTEASGANDTPAEEGSEAVDASLRGEVQFSAEDERRQEEHIAKLIREGKITRCGTGKIPEEFFTRPLPKAGASVLEALLEERRTGR
jgi:hypothetical protein